MDVKDDGKEMKFKGWGTWAGIGIEQKKISEEDKINKKKMEIV